mmetsp:Transcript_24619/g.46823  ORF Transcript_24619/g.46823 Transcript_24619/m.46823 type:complete len:535 (-) Transcript_24619:44-1648(-)|eukprot:scaffold6007_cov183-Amphora_coffeaeformis.AAC.7
MDTTTTTTPDDNYPNKAMKLDKKSSSSMASSNSTGTTASSATSVIMDPVQFIGIRRDQHRPYTHEELQWWMQAYTAGDVPNYQMAAWLMAVNLNGLSAPETALLTRCMVESGRRLDWSDRVPRNTGLGAGGAAASPAILVDKHSTGGVGDSVSLLLAPLAACMGLKVPMMAGRGLGHTGGTIDKLEAIPGFDVGLELDRFQHLVQTVGCCIIAAGPSLAPADKKLYALRDVTNTVRSLPLITASIMCKKIAENPHSIVLDTKYGHGAFMETFDKAQALAESMIAVGEANGLHPTTALLTRMEEVIGDAVGNWLEVEECIRILRGGDFSQTCPLCYDLIVLTCMQVGQMLLQSGLDNNKDLGQWADEAFQVLQSGAALTKFREMVAAQGGDVDYIDHPEGRYPPREKIAVTAPCKGFVTDICGLKIGLLGVQLGAGRYKSSDVVDFVPGFVMNKKVGSRVNEGDVLAWILTGKKHDTLDIDSVAQQVMEAFEITDEPPPLVPIVTHRVTSFNGTQPLSLPPRLQSLYDAAKSAYG